MNFVFASGFLVPQRLLGINYFRGVEAHLKGKHGTVFPPVDPLASSAQRARELADGIHQKFPEGPVHIIAHSMGGLDGRNLIAANLHGLAEPGRIASLTTLSTPHKGSPVADLLVGPRPGGLHGIAFDAISDLLRTFGVSTDALRNLTTKNASATPDVAKTHPHIRYRSFFAAGRSGLQLPTSAILLPTHEFTRSVTGQLNDGVVARDLAIYGEFQQTFWQCDHADMIGHNLDDDLDPRFDHLAHIDAIIAAL